MTPRTLVDDHQWSELVVRAMHHHATIGVTLRAIAAELPERFRRPWLLLADAVDRADESAAVAVARTDPQVCLPLVGCDPDDPRLLPRLLRTALDMTRPIDAWWAPLAYPLLVAVVTLGLLAVLLVSIVPIFHDILEGFGAAPPAITRSVFALCAFVATGWKPAALLVAVAGAVWAVAGRLAPRRSEVTATFTRSLAWLVGGGMSVDAAIRVAARVVGTRTPNRERPAGPLTHAAIAAVSCPPPAAVTLLEAVADCHEDRARRRRGMLTSAIGVVLTLVVSLVVAVVVVGLMAPLVRLVSVLT